MPQPKKELVSRSRLLKQFDHGYQKKLIFLQAPAGYGKTTAIVEWLSQSQHQSAWYSIDNGDNDVIRFLSYIVYGLEKLQSGLHESLLPLLNSTEPPPTDLLLAQLINDFSELDHPTILVLDDYHLITKKEIHDALSYIIHHLPPNLQIVVISRAELPFSISTLRVDGQVLELDIIDLRFTVKETEKFVNDVLHLSLSKELVAQLEQRTDGWVSGLQLAAMSMRRKGSADEFIQHLSGNDRFITNYIVDEVISNMPESTYKFLLYTSVLDRFCPELCDHVLNINTSHEIIEILEQCNSFIIPLDHQKTWYRYHHLFAELLQQRLARQGQDKARQIYEKASLWHEMQEHLDEAIDYSLKARDNQRLAALLNDSIKSMILHGNSEKAIYSLKALPIDMLRSKKNLWMYLILALLDRGEFRDSRLQLDRLWGQNEWTSNVSPLEKRQIQGYTNCFNAAIHIHTALNANAARDLTMEAQQLLSEDEYHGQSIAYGHFGSSSMHLGEITQAAASLDKAVQFSLKTGYDLIYLLWFSYRAQVEFKAGNLIQAKNMFDQSAEYAASRGLNMSNVFINAIVGLGCIHYEWDDIDTAHRYLLEGVKLAEFGENIDRLVFAYTAYFRYLMAMQDFDKANDKLSHLRKKAALYHNPPVILGRIEALETELALAGGKVNSDPANDLSALFIPEDEKNHLHEHKWFARAKFCAANNKTDKAIDIINTLVDIAQRQKRNHSLISLKTMRAHLFLKVNESEQAMQNLKGALEIAEPQQYHRIFVEGGEYILPLLTQLVDENIESAHLVFSPSIDYVRRIIASINNEKTASTSADKKATKKSLVTTREREVIHLLADGLSYIEIADRMNISINTLKTYIKSIYTKLNIHNKVEAINKAKELNLF